MINSQVKEIVEKHLADQEFTACAVGIQSFGKDPDFFVVGKTYLDQSAQKVDANSLFDIASITKVMFTTTLAADVFENGKLDLNAPLGNWIPDCFYQTTPLKIYCKRFILKI